MIQYFDKSNLTREQLEFHCDLLENITKLQEEKIIHLKQVSVFQHNELIATRHSGDSFIRSSLKMSINKDGELEYVIE
jgi:hypothetical protein